MCNKNSWFLAIAFIVFYLLITNNKCGDQCIQPLPAGDGCC